MSHVKVENTSHPVEALPVRIVQMQVCLRRQAPAKATALAIADTQWIIPEPVYHVRPEPIKRKLEIRSVQTAQAAALHLPIALH